MRIISLKTGTISLPLSRPFKTSLRTVTHLRSVVVRAVSDSGMVGYGEAPPTAAITGETLGSITSAIGGYIAPAVIGADLSDLEGVMARLHSSIAGNTSAKAAVDMAVYDLLAKSHGLPLYKFLGGGRGTLTTDITVSLSSADQMVRDALAAVANGYSALKVKVGTSPGDDIVRIASVRAAVGDGISLLIDVNQGWDAESAVRAITKLEDMGLNPALVEQPVKARDLAGMRHVTANVRTPILADESVFSPRDALEIIRTRAADMINIKLMKSGGIHRALDICSIAARYGVSCMMGCMLESAIAVSAAAHLCASQGVFAYADLDGPSLCASHPFDGGPRFIGPQIIMTTDAGIGIDNIPFDNKL